MRKHRARPPKPQPLHPQMNSGASVEGGRAMVQVRTEVGAVGVQAIDLFQFFVIEIR